MHWALEHRPAQNHVLALTNTEDETLLHKLRERVLGLDCWRSTLTYTQEILASQEQRFLGHNPCGDGFERPRPCMSRETD